MERRKSRFSIISSVENASSIPRNISIIKEQTHTTSDSCTNISTRESSENNQPQTTQSKIIDNFIIVWLCSNINGSITDRDDLRKKLQHIINGFQTFTDINECIDFLTDILDKKVIMIINDYLDQNFLRLIDGIPQLHSVYIFNNDREKHEQFSKEFKFVRGTYSQIEHICSAVKQDAYRLVVDLTPISVIPPNSSLNLDELDQCFMYTQLLKEIIIEIKYDAEKAREEFTQFCLSRSAADGLQPNTINRFQQCYEDHSPIWWYTKEWLIYSSLNRALRMQDIELITKMGFFVQDLHRQIEKQHSEAHDTSKITVYRGQALSNDDFEKLRKSKGGLFSFNNFLSTSVDRAVSFAFADSNQQNHNITAVLFKMEIDPSISSTPFVRIENIGQFESEAEILFSMHTVFRIGDMNQIDQRLWEVNLILTSDNDRQLKCLTDCIRNEIGGRSGWFSMGLLMYKMGKYDKIIEILNISTEIMSEGDPKELEILQAVTGNYIGLTQHALGNYSAALTSYEKSLKICQELRPYDHSCIAHVYSDIGSVYQSVGNFSSAILSLEKALESQQQSLSSNSNILAKIYNNLALTHQSMGSSSSALSYLEKALELQEISLPSGHPVLAVSHSNIAFVHQSMGSFSIALTNLEKALGIQQKFLPPGHPDLATTYNNIGGTHLSMGNYSTALSYFERTLEIQQKSLPSGHPALARSHSNIAVIHQSLSSFSSALTNFEKALEIQQKALPSDHPDLAMTRNNIGEVYRSKGNYAAALSYYEKALEMWQKTLPHNHPNLATAYNNMAVMYQSLGNYSTALCYYEKTLEIQQNSLPPYHPDIVRTHANIASLNQLNQDYLSAASNTEKAFKNHQKLLSINQLSSTTACSNVDEMTETFSEILSNTKRVAEMQQKLIPSDGSDVTVTDENIDEANELMEKSLNMILNLEKALEFYKKYPSVNRPLDPGIQVNSVDENQMIEHSMTTISQLKKGLGIQQTTSSFANEEADFNDDEMPPSMDHFSLALSSYQNMFEILQKYSPPNDVSLSTNYNNIGQRYYSFGDYVNALSLFEKALDNLQKCSPINQQLLAKTYSNIAKAFEGLSRYRDAIDNAKQAFEIAHSTLGSNHPETEAYRNRFDQLRRKL